MNKERYQKVLDCIRFLAEIAHQEGWIIPKDRKDLRCAEIVRDKNFWRAIKKYFKDA